MNHIEKVFLFFAIPVVLLYIFLNIGDYPVISGWDEGIYLQFSETLAEHGEYATLNNHNFDLLSPSGGTGPTLVFPIMLAFKIFGKSLIAARVTMGFYLVLFMISAYLLVRTIGGWKAALISIPFLLTAGVTNYDTLWVGRQVLAEIPSLAFLFLGLWLWMKSWTNWRWLFPAIIFFALTVVTKNQFIWVIVPSLIIVLGFSLFYFKGFSKLILVLIILGSVIGLFLWQLIAHGIVGDNFQAYLDTCSALTTSEFLRPNINRWIENSKLIIKSGQIVLVALATLYGMFALFKKRNLKRSVLFSVFAIALLSSTFLCTPWPRLIYPLLALSSLITAIFIGDLLDVYLLKNVNKIWLFGILILVLGLFTLPRLIDSGQKILMVRDDSAPKMASLIDKIIPNTDYVLNWEWEVEFYSNTSFAHPPFRLFPALIDEVYNEKSCQILKQPRIPSDAKYLLIGPFAEQTKVFNKELSLIPNQIIKQVGPYKLYKLNQ
jgi:hypothetical protein